MTDYPRFRPVHGTIETSHRLHHGAALVDLVLSASDWWLEGFAARFQTSAGPGSRAAKLGLAALAALLFCLSVTAVAAQEQCAGLPVEVTASSPEERALVCSAAGDAILMLDRCSISPRRPLRVHVLSEVLHPFSGPIFGLFDAKLERVMVTREASIPALVEGTPYAGLPQRDFYRSLIVHEVVHGVMHQNLKKVVMTHAAHEYPAFALQMESLPAQVRESFLRSFEPSALEGDTLFSDVVLSFNPYYFAARAYRHFKAAADPCAHLAALLDGEVAFIAPPWM